jgi:uncharacterized protein YeaO (DUF488 family)
MALKTKRWNDPREPDDGYRLLVCRYRPRGVARADETWDAWWPQLGPSKELHAQYWGKRGEPLSFDEYVPRYLDEMKSQGEWLKALALRLAAGETITLLCSSACTDPARCHRTVLAELITSKLPARPRPRA